MKNALKAATLTALMACGAARALADDARATTIPEVLDLLEAKTGEGRTLIPWIRERMSRKPEDGGIELKLADDFGQAALYDYNSHVVYINKEFFASDPRLAAAMLQHELYHAKQQLQLGYWNAVEGEFEGTIVQLHAAAELGALDVSAEGKSKHERWLLGLHRGFFMQYSYDRTLFMDWMRGQYYKADQWDFLDNIQNHYRDLLRNLDSREPEVRRKLAERADKMAAVQAAVLDAMQKKGLLDEKEKTRRLDAAKSRLARVKIFAERASAERLRKALTEAVDQLEAQKASWTVFLAADDQWRRAHADVVAKWAEIHKAMLKREDKVRVENHEGEFPHP